MNEDRKKRFKDIAGQRFGRLVAVSLAEESYKPGAPTMWLCKCDCGEEVLVRKESLQYGNTRSCGCLRKEVIPHNIVKVLVDYDGTSKTLAEWAKTFNCHPNSVYREILAKEGRVHKCKKNG